MVEDARFEDGGERPLRLLAMDAEDLGVISALTQDAVFPITEMTWQPQRRRFIAEMDEKARVYGERYPIDEDFLAALAHMPGASGCALGFDRLVMLASGMTRIDQVVWTPPEGWDA